MLERWGAFVARRALWVLLAGVALVLAAGAYGSGVFDSLSQGGFDDPDSEASRELALERDTFGNRGVDAVAIYSSDDLTADAPEFRSAVEDAVARIPEGTTSSVTTYYDTQSPDMVSEDGHSVQVQISLEGVSQDALLDNWDEVEPTLEAGRARHRRGRRVRGVRRRQRDHVRGPRPRREDLAADRRPAGAAHLRQPRRRRDARAGRRPRRGRVPRGGADDHRLHRGLDLLRQRDHPARDGSRDRLRPVHDQQVPRGAGRATRSTTPTPRPRPSCPR